MIIVHAVIQILWSQCPLLVKCLSLKKGIIHSNVHRILRKVNQVIYIMYPYCMPDVMILAQAVLQIFMSQGCVTMQSASRTRGIIQQNIYRILPKVNQVLTLDTIYVPNRMVLAQAVF